MRWFTVLALVALAGVTALNWRAQVQTQQKLDALTTARAERPVPAVPTPAPTPSPAPRAPERVPTPAPGSGAGPRELSNVKLPPYVIEAPDTLRIEAVVKDAKTGAPERLPDQPISGSFVVRPDGTVGLGRWGSVSVAGLTTEQAESAVRQQVVKGSEKVPATRLVVTVEVQSRSSKRYYVITDGTGSGEQVMAFPITGAETVLDAIANIDGLPKVAAERSIRVERRGPTPGEPWQSLPVDWKAITQNDDTSTNYPLLPGDRIYVTRPAQ